MVHLWMHILPQNQLLIPRTQLTQIAQVQKFRPLKYTKHESKPIQKTLPTRKIPITYHCRHPSCHRSTTSTYQLCRLHQSPTMKTQHPRHRPPTQYTITNLYSSYDPRPLHTWPINIIISYPTIQPKPTTPTPLDPWEIFAETEPEIQTTPPPHIQPPTRPRTNKRMAPPDQAQQQSWQARNNKQRRQKVAITTIQQKRKQSPSIDPPTRKQAKHQNQEQTTNNITSQNSHLTIITTHQERKQITAAEITTRNNAKQHHPEQTKKNTTTQQCQSTLEQPQYSPNSNIPPKYVNNNNPGKKRTINRENNCAKSAKKGVGYPPS